MPFNTTASKTRSFNAKPLIALSAGLLCAAFAASWPAHATNTTNSNSVHKPIKHGRTATHHQKKLIGQKHPGSVRSNQPAKTQ